MSKLTKYVIDGYVASNFNYDFVLEMPDEDFEGFKEIVNKLGHYEKLEDEGRLIELPCAVGDKIYDPETGKPFDKVIQFVIDKNGVHCKTLSVLAEMEGAE